MQDFPETRQSLLVRVQRDDREAWQEFSAIYRPLLYRIARRRGWQDADAQDVAQTVLTKVAKAIADFQPDPHRARLRSWLTTVCHNTLRDEFRRRQSDRSAVASVSELEHLPAASPDISEDELSLEHRRQVFRWAASKARDVFADATWLAFSKTAVNGEPVRTVSSELGISVGAVYTARSRVMQFLKNKVKEVDDAELQ